MSNGEEMSPSSNEVSESLKLPESLDNTGSLFAYGFLLDQDKLRELLSTRSSGFPIHEVTSMEEFEKTRADKGDAIVILRGVQMQGVEVQIHTEKQMRDWLDALPPDERPFGNSDDLVAKGILTAESTHAGLFALPGGNRFLNGGIITGLTDAELERLDGFEMLPVYQRVRVPALNISSHSYTPKYITFYAGNSDMEKRFGRNLEEVRRARELLRTGRGEGVVGEIGPNMKWPHDRVRREAKEN